MKKKVGFSKRSLLQLVKGAKKRKNKWRRRRGGTSLLLSSLLTFLIPFFLSLLFLLVNQKKERNERDRHQEEKKKEGESPFFFFSFFICISLKARVCWVRKFILLGSSECLLNWLLLGLPREISFSSFSSTYFFLLFFERKTSLFINCPRQRMSSVLFSGCMTLCLLEGKKTI